MEPKQALAILDKATSTYQGTRQEHVNIQAAILVLNDIISPRESEKKPKELGTKKK